MAHPHSPMGRDGRQALPFSRRDFLRVRAMRHAIPKNDAATRPSSEQFGRGEIRGAQDRARRTRERTNGKKKRKQNADRRGSTCLPCGKRAPCRARSPVGVPRRFCPWDSRIPRCGVGPGFAALAPTMAGVSRRRQPRLQRAPRTPVIVPADMMSDTARVQRGRTLCARAPHPAPASRSHRLTSLHEEREAGAFSRRARRVKPNHLARVSI